MTPLAPRMFALTLALSFTASPLATAPPGQEPGKGARQGGGREAQRILVLPGRADAIEARFEFVAPGWLEPEGRAGVADLAVALLGRAAAEPGGVAIAVTRDRERLTLSLACAPSDLAAGMAQVGRLRGTRTFAAGSFEAERAALAAHLSERERPPAEPAPDLATRALTNRRPPVADSATVAELTPDALSGFLESALALDRMSVAVAGPVPLGAARALIAEAVGAPAPPSAIAGSWIVDARPGLRGRVVDVPGARRCDLRLSLAADPRHAHYAERLLIADLFAADPERNPDAVWTVVPPLGAGDDGLPLYLYRSVAPDAELAAAVGSALGVFDGLEDVEESALEAVRERRMRSERARAAQPQVRLARALAAARRPETGRAWAGLVDALAGIELDDLEQAVELLPAAPAVLSGVGPAEALEPALAAHMPVELLTRDGESAGADVPLAAEALRGTPDGRMLAGRLLEALGGRARWASLRTLRTRATADLAQVDGLVTVATTADLTRGHLRIENVIGDNTVVWGLGPNGSWSATALGVAELPPGSAERLRMRHERSLFAVLRSLAAGQAPPVRAGPQGRLELADAAGVWCWIELDGDGRPERLGYGVEGERLETVYKYSQWTVSGGWHYPVHVHQLDRGNEYETTAFEPDAELAPGTFERP